MNYAVWEPLIEIEFNIFENQKLPNYCLCSRAFIKSICKFDFGEFLEENSKGYKIYYESSSFDKKKNIKPYYLEKMQKTSNFLFQYLYKINDNVSQITFEENLCKKIFICYIDQILNSCHFCNTYYSIMNRESIIIKKFNLEVQLKIFWQMFWSENRNHINWKYWFEIFSTYNFQDYVNNFEKISFVKSFYLMWSKIYKNYQIEYENRKKCKKCCKTWINNNTNIIESDFKLCFNDIIIKEKTLDLINNGNFFPDKKKANFLISSLNMENEFLGYCLWVKKENKVISVNKNNFLYNYSFFVNHRNFIIFINVMSSNLSSSNVKTITKCNFSMLCSCNVKCSLSLISLEVLPSRSEIWLKSNLNEHDFFHVHERLTFENFKNNFINVWKQKKIDFQNNDNCEKNSVRDLIVIKKNNFLKIQQYLNSIGYCLQMLEKFNNRNEIFEKAEFQSNQFFGVPKNENKAVKNFKSHLIFTENDCDCIMKECISQKRNCKKKIRKRKKKYKKDDKIYRAFTLMGYSFKKNEKNKLSGNVIYWKKNIWEHNKLLKNNEKKPKLHLFFDDKEEPYESKADNFKDFFFFEEKIITSFKTSIKKSENNLIDLEMYPIQSSLTDVKKSMQKKNKKNFSNLPQEIIDNTVLLKYWHRRYQLFSKFDEGIKLDEESWFSVTPEALAKHHSERCRCDIILDAFCGAGGNSIQFAFTCERVIAIDIDPQKIELAKHNAKIYGVEDRIEFIIGDFTKLAFTLFGDVVFLSPPWGGPGYIKEDVYSLNNILPPLGGHFLFTLATEITENVAFFLPKNTDSIELTLISGPGGEVEIEQNFVGHRLRSLTAYFGELILDPEKY